MTKILNGLIMRDRFWEGRRQEEVTFSCLLLQWGSFMHHARVYTIRGALSGVDILEILYRYYYPAPTHRYI